jgi:hypothetical protein
MDTLRARWRGPHWKRWSFLAGAAAVLLTTLIVPLVALALGVDPTSLTLLVLAIESVGVALVGAGLLERLSGRMIAGGLARQPHPERRPTATPSDAERERRDRLAIRAGLIVLPIFATFVALLFVS